MSSHTARRLLVLVALAAVGGVGAQPPEERVVEIVVLAVGEERTIATAGAFTVYGGVRPPVARTRLTDEGNLVVVGLRPGVGSLRLIYPDRERRYRIRVVARG